MSDDLPENDDRKSRKAILRALCDFADKALNLGFVSTSDRESQEFILGNAFAFCVAACIDRRAKSELVWRVPLRLQKSWGHLDPARIKVMGEQAIVAGLRDSGCGWQLKLEDVARTIIEVATVVTDRCGGDADRLFDGTASEILRRLDSIFGVGKGIANLIVIMRVRYFGLLPPGLEVVTVKPDVHVRRVFYRTGLSDSEKECATLAAAAALTVDDRLAVDQAAWYMGKTYCHVSRTQLRRMSS